MLLQKCPGSTPCVAKSLRDQQKSTVKSGSNTEYSFPKLQNREDTVSFRGDNNIKKDQPQTVGLQDLKGIEKQSEQQQNEAALLILKSDNQQLKSDFQDFVLENADSGIFKNPKAIISTMVDNLNTGEERKAFVSNLYLSDNSFKPQIISKLVDKLSSSENELLLHSFKLVQSVPPQHKKEIIEKIIQKTSDNETLCKMYQGLEKVSSDIELINDSKLEIHKKYTGPKTDLVSSTWVDGFKETFSPPNFTDIFSQPPEEIGREIWQDILRSTYSWIPGLNKESK